MSKTTPLRQRILLSNIILTLLVCLLFILIFIFAEKYTERYIFDKQMDTDLERYINSKDIGESFIFEPGIKIYQGDDIPEYMRELKPSSSTYEIIYEEKEYAIRVSRVDAEHFVVVQDRGVFETIEYMVFLSLGLATLLCLLLSYYFSKLLSNKVIKPLSNLTTLVSTDVEPNKRQVDFSTDEVAVLAQAIDDRNIKLRGFIDRERMFTSDVSHELRTPLTIILGAAEVLQVKLKNDSSLIQYVDRIKNTALATSQRLTALFLLSRSPESIDAPLTAIYEIVENEINSNQHLLSNKPVICLLEGDESVFFHARSELVSIAIGNLIRNAFLYTDKGQVVAKLSQDHLIIDDSGSGIPVNIRENLFERYVHGPDSNRPDSGLGLSIVKRVCDHLGWHISYEKKDSGGSRFTIMFNQ